MRYRRHMPDLEITDPLGIALLAIGAFVAFKAIKAVVKVAMVLVMLIGAYLWFGVDAGAAGAAALGVVRAGVARVTG
jgi:hypothetical protein